MPHALFAGIEAHGEILHLALQGVDARVHLQQHAHHDLRPALIDRQRFFPRHHEHNSRGARVESALRKSLISG